MHRRVVHFFRAISEIALIMAFEYYLTGMVWGGIQEYLFEELVYCMLTVSFGYGALQYLINMSDRGKEVD